MSLIAKIHSKTLQIAVSREDFVHLADTGETTIEVRDLLGNAFGTVTMKIENITRAAMLEHLDMPYPAHWLDRANQGRAAAKRRF